MPEKNKDTARTLNDAGQKSKFAQVEQGATPTTPGGGPTPDAPTRRLNEPSVGPAGSIAAMNRAQQEQGSSTGHRTDEQKYRQGASSAGDVAARDASFDSAPLSNRQEVEEGETTTDPRGRG